MYKNAEVSQDLTLKSKNANPILIVDDKYLTLMLLEKTLSRNGYTVICVENAEQAIEVIETTPVSVIICDYQMPTMTGVDVLAKAVEKQPHAIRILITGNREISIALEAVNIGQVSYILTKPWEEIELLQVTKNALETYHLVQENSKLQELTTKQHQDLLQKNEYLKNEHDLGIRIHDALLVGNIPKECQGFSIAVSKSLSKDLAADFFDFYQPTPTIFDLVIGDVMGTGIASALVGTAIKAQLTRFVLSPHSFQVKEKQKIWVEDLLTIEEVMTNLQEELTSKLFHLEYFASLFFARFNGLKQELHYIDCGAAKPIHYKAEQKVASCLIGNNLSLGTIQDDTYQSIKITYHIGDIFLFYSPRIFFNLKSEDEYIEFLNQLLTQYAHLNVHNLLEVLKQEIYTLLDRDPSENDLMMIVLKIDDNPYVEEISTQTGKFSADLSQLKPLRSFVERVCEKAPGPLESLVNQLQLAINEIFCNIVEHGDTKRNEIVIQVEYTQQGITFNVADQGTPFDPSNIIEPSLAGDRTSGFGLYMIRQIADEINYIPKSAKNGWNHLRLFKKYFSGEDIMEFEVEQKEGVLILTPKISTLDAKDSAEFKEKVLDYMNQFENKNLIFNLTNLHFIDSSGLGIFLSLLRTIHTKNGEMKLAVMNKPIRTMFELVSMHKIFEMYNSVEEAVSSFQK